VELENCCRKSTWFWREEAMLEDIAILTGGTVISEEEDILLRIQQSRC
jgi:hypothetical protein